MEHVAVDIPKPVAIDPMTPVPATSSLPDVGHIDLVEGSPNATPVAIATEVTPHPIPEEFNIT